MLKTLAAFPTIVPNSTFGGAAVIRDILPAGTANALEVHYTSSDYATIILGN